MESFRRVFLRIDGWMVKFEENFCGCGIILVTGMITLAVVARFFFRHTFSWLEELTQYIMVWIVCMGGVLCVAHDEHVGVDLVFTFLPKKLHASYKLVLMIVSTIFLAIFSYYTAKAIVMVKKNGQFSISMPWLKMYWLYVGVMLGTVLMCYEYVKLCFRILWNSDSQVDISPEKLEKL